MSSTVTKEKERMCLNSNHHFLTTPKTPQCKHVTIGDVVWCDVVKTDLFDMLTSTLFQSVGEKSIPLLNVLQSWRVG